MYSSDKVFIVVLYLMYVLINKSIQFIVKYFFTKRLNLKERYGENSWAIITGGSSGQGKVFAIELANEGFNIIIIGSERSYNTQKEIQKRYPDVKVIVIERNFNDAYKKKFFKKIKEKIQEISNGDISIMINNIGHRTAWEPYHEMPDKLINDTIACGTLVQAHMTKIALGFFMKREDKSILVNITVQCMHSNLFSFIENYISLPYLSVYEGCNAFGFYHANSIQKEYENEKKIDMLNITPGAVITENTQFLDSTLFSVDAKIFVNNIIDFMGNIQGTTCGYWGHEISNVLINVAPFMKYSILEKVGNTICKNYMNNIYKK